MKPPATPATAPAPVVTPPPPAFAAGLPGFTERTAAAQRQLEARFRAVPSTEGVTESVLELSAQAHMAGGAANQRVGDRLAERMRGLGFEVTVEEQPVLLPYPKSQRLSLLGPGGGKLSMVERVSRGKLAASTPELMNWNAYAASGKVTAPVVYGFYGRREDYATLEAQKVDVRGKIMLLRYGPLYRGAQVAHAEAHGAAAVVFYMDPADEADRPTDTVQRGSILYFWKYGGDPLTPDGPSATTPPLPAAKASALPKIPALAISADDAKRIMGRLQGAEVPAAWMGKLGLPYHLGDGKTKLALEVRQDGKRRTIRNIIATLHGQSPHTIVLGNHYDAWVYGAADPHSGTSVMLEIAKGLSQLVAGGWKPRRTITMAFWDAEEFGVVGSSEFVERHRAELVERAVAYLNIDTIKAATVVVQGEHALRDTVLAAADAVPDATGASLGAAWLKLQTDAHSKKWASRPEAERPAFTPALNEIGIGSDWTAFVHHAGVPSLQFQTQGGPGVYQVWHSVDDDFTYAGTKTDPGFRFAPLYAQFMGLVALRLTEAEALPLRYSVTAARLGTQLDELAATSALALDGRLKAAITRFGAAATAFEARQLEAAVAGGDLAALERTLIGVQRAFLIDGGLEGRPWYRFVLNSANQDNGYGAQPLPELAIALAQRADPAAAVERATTRLEAALARAAALLETP